MTQINLIALPGGVQVGVRDWLSANHIFLQGDTGNIIIDTGYVTHAATTRAYVESAFGELKLDLIVNTHQHSDHMGCNAYLQRWTGAPIAIPEGERELIARWDTRALWLDYADQMCERFTPHIFLTAGEHYRWGNLDWHAIAAPGHDDGTLVFYNAAHRILISADALWENGFGFIVPQKWDATAAMRARAALDTIAALDVDWVVPGHGMPFQNVRRALDISYARLAAMEADDERVARSISKGMFVYALLARERIAISDLPQYVQSVGCHAEINAQFLHWSAQEHAQWLVDEALKTQHFTRLGDDLQVARAGD